MGVRPAFTLVELLVVIAIIGVLVALLLPAIQAAREAARRSQCLNNLKQLGLGSLNHESQNGFYPTGGWSYDWGPDPDRGFGEKQPGGWMYNLLPFIEQSNLRDLGSGAPINSQERRQAMQQLIQTPVDAYRCPTRGRGPLALSIWNSPVKNLGNWVRRVAQTEGVLKGDYAANSGDTEMSDGAPWFGGAPSALTGDYGPAEERFEVRLRSTPMDFCDPPNSGLQANWLRHCQSGVIFVRSEVDASRIPDGTSNTYLIGEKHVDPVEYEGAASISDPGLSLMTNQAAYCGYEWDNQRRAWNPELYKTGANQYNLAASELYQPRPDTPNSGELHIFGSAHPGAFNMAYCDGSVRTINYDVDPFVHSYSANRLDGRSVVE